MLKACIFDFDGVLVDSEKYHHLAWQKLANELDVTFDYDEYAPFQSAGRQKVIPYLFEKANKPLSREDMEKYTQLRQVYTEEALSRLSEKDIMHGAVNFVRLLRQNGVRCAVASSSALSNRVAKRLGLYDIFDVFTDGEVGLAHKPAPDIFLYTAKLLGVQPSECVVFEDSRNGILAARNADMRCVGVRAYFTDSVPVIDDFENLTLQRIEQLCKTKF